LGDLEVNVSILWNMFDGYLQNYTQRIGVNVWHYTFELEAVF